MELLQDMLSRMLEGESENLLPVTDGGAFKRTSACGSYDSMKGFNECSAIAKKNAFVRFVAQAICVTVSNQDMTDMSRFFGIF